MKLAKRLKEALKPLDKTLNALGNWKPDTSKSRKKGKKSKDDSYVDRYTDMQLGHAGLSKEDKKKKEKKGK
jgi:hypothetical protein